MGRDLRVKEHMKMTVRTVLRRSDLELTRYPYMSRVARTLKRLHVDTVIDVGANIGQYGSALRSVGYSGRIVSCEPLSDAFAHLQRRAGRDDDWLPVRTALGSAPATVDITVSANSYSSSMRSMTAAHLTADPASRYLRRERVPVTTVLALMAERKLTASTTLLKVDTQGYETDVLDGAGSTLGDFAAVQLELSFVPLYESQQLIGPLTKRMYDQGFELFNVEPGISDRATGRLLQCDGLFVNTRSFERTSPSTNERA